MGWYREYDEPDDPLDDPKYEAEFHEQLREYWEKLDDKERYSE